MSSTNSRTGTKHHADKMLKLFDLHYTAHVDFGMTQTPTHDVTTVTRIPNVMSRYMLKCSYMLQPAAFIFVLFLRIFCWNNSMKLSITLYKCLEFQGHILFVCRTRVIML